MTIIPHPAQFGTDCDLLLELGFGVLAAVTFPLAATFLFLDTVAVAANRWPLTIFLRSLDLLVLTIVDIAHCVRIGTMNDIRFYSRCIRD